ncbi:MAG: hypothetical protein HY898_35740 [Deltaproteobacteria bacterium]|nr:hypothetical protein [Deltaproteobacteria bacterium]
MSGYRDELTAAQARIHALEEALEEAQLAVRAAQEGADERARRIEQEHRSPESGAKTRLIATAVGIGFAIVTAIAIWLALLQGTPRP